MNREEIWQHAKRYGDLDFRDVFILPQYSEVETRASVDTSVQVGNLKLGVPVISSNMDTVSGGAMCRSMYGSGGIGALHRFMSIDANVAEYRTVAESGLYECFVSIGVNDDSKDRAKALYEAGARYFVIDIAHGHSLMMRKTTEWLRETYPGAFIVSGNVATSVGVRDLVKWGADAVKVGVGPGCFVAGTRILMSNGTYKNIEDINPGDRVINMNGEAISVKRRFSTGYRNVCSYKTNVSGFTTRCTPDHRHYIGDLATSGLNTRSSAGYKKLLSKKSKTSPKVSKLKWKEISYAGDTSSVLLTPNKIKYELPNTFSIPLYKRGKGNYATLTPTYGLGYIFGTFLGDGTSHCVKQNSGSHIGSVCWAFGLDEKTIANKLNESILSVFGREASSISDYKNTTIVRFSDKPFAEFLQQFGKRDNKHLPDMLLVDDAKYLQGIYDGLIDSDGFYGKDDQNCFKNTSIPLVELFSILNSILLNYFPNIDYEKPTAGGLINCLDENCLPSYKCRTLKRPEWRILDEHQVIKILDYTEQSKLLEEVFDLEVDCPTHSFIANNVIVHNSVCLTKNTTGCTCPQFSAVLNCAKIVDEEVLMTGFGNRPLIIADGGITEYGDIAKALGAGANLVMIGGMFAGCKEAPGERIGDKKVFRGMASKSAMLTIRPADKLPTAEGKSILIDATDISAGTIVEQMKGGLRSSFSYSNSRNLREFQENIELGIRFNKE